MKKKVAAKKSKVKRKRVQMCKQWPKCACILRGSIEDCRPTWSY